jgi:hypothetical protein
VFCFSRTTLFRDTQRTAWLCPVVLSGNRSQQCCQDILSANSIFISVALNAYCFRKRNCYLSATCVRPRDTVKSDSTLTIFLSICNIQFEKFDSIEKFINPWSKFISLTVIYCLTLNKFKWSNGGSVGIITKLLARQPGVWSPARERVFSTMSRRVLWSTQTPIQLVRAVPSWGADRAWGWPATLLCLLPRSRNNGAVPPISAYAFMAYTRRTLPVAIGPQ